MRGRHAVGEDAVGAAAGHEAIEAIEAIDPIGAIVAACGVPARWGAAWRSAEGSPGRRRGPG